MPRPLRRGNASRKDDTHGQEDPRPHLQPHRPQILPQRHVSRPAHAREGRHRRLHRGQPRRRHAVPGAQAAHRALHEARARGRPQRTDPRIRRRRRHLHAHHRAQRRAAHRARLRQLRRSALRLERHSRTDRTLHPERQAAARVPANVALHKGWFDATLPSFLEANPGPVSFVNIDCDIYESTRYVLEQLRDRLRPGSVILFDEYYNYPNWREHEYRAWQEFVAANNIAYRYAGFSTMRYHAAVQITAIGNA
ncbi:MAG: TylF/MycF/NovP-related O-methyltransferase [Hyphomonadaceae bacterium]